MAETEPISKNVDNQRERQDISRIFTLLRAQLMKKEKELLELQRAEPFLLAPDADQVNSLVNAISSLHLCTQDGSFLFASNSTPVSDNSSIVHSTGVDAIKTLPSSVWLAEKKKLSEEPAPYRLPLVAELFSLPTNAFVASSTSQKSKCPVTVSPSTCETDAVNRLPMVAELLSLPKSAFISTPSVQTSEPCAITASSEIRDEPSNRLPMVRELLSMPISAFRSSSSSSTTTVPLSVKESKKELDNEQKPTIPLTIKPKSIFEVDPMYSKEFWLRKSDSSSTSTNYETSAFDVEKYIEQSSEKMRRLHLQYMSALDQLNVSTDKTDSKDAIKTLYPQVFERIQPDLPSKNRQPVPSSK